MPTANNPSPDVVIIMTDEERAAPVYESADTTRWREQALSSWSWWSDHAVMFDRHYTGSLACVPSRPTLFTGHYPAVHGVTQTDGLGKDADDSAMRWLEAGTVPTIGNWFRLAGYDTHYDGKWHISHADLIDPDTGQPIATNDDEGNIDPAAVERYLDADPLGPFGFSGWVGPEPHGGSLANCGVHRDPLIAARTVAWLNDRYQRRRDGDPDALRPFLLVASFVNPHDIVLFPVWKQFGSPLADRPAPDVPDIAPPPTARDLPADRPTVQHAYQASYFSAYGYPERVQEVYEQHASEYRSLYYRLHAEVDGHVDLIRRTVTDSSDHAVLVRTSDHGELLGAHGGLHQKWYQLYEETTRVPFAIARIGDRATTAATVADMPTSHVDMVPTLLDLAGIDRAAVAEQLAASHSTVAPLPGRSLADVIEDPEAIERGRAVYLMTTDHILSGDTGASALARALGLSEVPPELAIDVPSGMPTAVEGVVARLADGSLWKLVRTYDDEGADESATDDWEFYLLDDDPIEAENRFDELDAADLLAEARQLLMEHRERARASR